jgi:hypothetical protein
MKTVISQNLRFMSKCYAILLKKNNTSESDGIYYEYRSFSRITQEKNNTINCVVDTYLDFIIVQIESMSRI